MNESEKHITVINSSFFFKEFTFSKNNFKDLDDELELADSIVWVDDFFLIYQIKERNQTQEESNLKNWFKNKVLGKAVKQIKSTLQYLDKFDKIIVENERGEKFDLTKANRENPIKLIIYSPGAKFPEEDRFLKFYTSKVVGKIHLFHKEDYLWICRYLITPFEIEEYLRFRKNLYEANRNELDNLPEQYVLGHYLETNEDIELNPSYVDNLKNLEADLESFNISPIVENFNRLILYSTGKSHYYYILKELAKLNRSDLRGFKQRYDLALEKAKNQEPDIPYRMTSLYSKCGFVFIPLEFTKKDKWENAVRNFSTLHKYEQKLDKVVGMVCYYNPKKKYYDIYWTYINSVWEFEEDLEKIVKENFPLRSVKMEKTFRYHIKK